MRRHLLGTTAIVAVSLVVGVSCTDDSTVQARQDETSDHADDAQQVSVLGGDVLIGVVPAAAVLGEELFVAEQHSADGTRVVMTEGSGSVKELAEAPALQSRALVGVGESLMMVGVRCEDETCDTASLAGYRYSPTDTTWVELEMPKVEIYADTMVEAVGGTDSGAVVDVGAGLILLGADGAVTDITATGQAPVPSLGCATSRTGDVYDVQLVVQGETPPEDPQSVVVEGALVYSTPVVLRAGRSPSSDSWQQLDAPPFPGNPSEVSVLCDADSLLLIADGSEYRYSDAGWQANPAAKVLEQRWRDRPIQTQSATTNAGVMVTVGVNGTSPIVRSPSGEWSTLDVAASAVLGAAGSGVFVADRVENSVRFIDVSSFER
jgi:hypothetical protein